MREKVRMFRSLLLEPLECRAVFSVDGLDVWQIPHHSLNVELDPFQPGQFPNSQSTAENRDLQNRDIDRSKDIHNEIFVERRTTHRASHRETLEIDLILSLPAPEGEARPFDADPTSFNSNASQPIQPGESQVVVIVDTSPIGTVLSLPHNITPASNVRPQVDSNISNRVDIHPTNFAVGNASVERAPTSNLQNSAAATPVVATSNSLTQANLAAWSLSPLGTTTFDFSSRLGSNSERTAANDLGTHRADELHFAKPKSIASDSIFDQTLIERAASVQSLENLLSNLAENHRRGRFQNGFDSNQPNSRSEQNWLPDQTAASVEITIADGGMIALALNRDIALSELEDISDDARSENKAWTANVGIFRAFENGAVAATEYAGLTNRITRNVETNSTTSELSEVEAEVANTQLHPLLASTSAALGVVMFGLRRIRKPSPLMFNSRKR